MSKQTDWTSYYAKPSPVSAQTRKIALRHILSVFAAHTPLNSRPRIIECGGGNSCFFAKIYEALAPELYTVLDNNALGLEKFLAENQKHRDHISIVDADLLAYEPEEKYDIVFSAGLIEHFDEDGTAKMIRAHFRLAREGGLVVIGFPTPTRQYRAIRKMMELAGLWKFFDERPLRASEVEPAFLENGEILDKLVLRNMPLTQMYYAILAK